MTSSWCLHRSHQFKDSIQEVLHLARGISNCERGWRHVNISETNFLCYFLPSVFIDSFNVNIHFLRKLTAVWKMYLVVFNLPICIKIKISQQICCLSFSNPSYKAHSHVYFQYKPTQIIWDSGTSSSNLPCNSNYIGTIMTQCFTLNNVDPVKIRRANNPNFLALLQSFNCCTLSQKTFGLQDTCLRHQQQCFHMLIHGDEAALSINKAKTAVEPQLLMRKSK